MYAGVLRDIDLCIRQKRHGRIPIFAASEEFDVRMAGVVYSDYNSDARIMARTQIEAVRNFDYDWAWLQVDDCIEFEALGVGVKGGGNVLPATCDYLPATWETFRGLAMPDMAKGRFAVLVEAIKRVKDALGDDACVVGRVPAPFTAVTLLYGMSESMLMLYDESSLFEATLPFMEELVTRFGLLQIEAGADALWVGDCNASGHLISADFYRRYAAAAAKRCISAFKAAGGRSFYHASEHQEGHIREQLAIGADVLNVGPGVDISVPVRIAGELGAGCVAGNLDPIGVLLNGSPDDVRRETRRILEAGSKTQGYIFNSGEMIPRDTPEVNMRAMIETVRAFALN